MKGLSWIQQSSRVSTLVEIEDIGLLEELIPALDLVLRLEVVGVSLDWKRHGKSLFIQSG